MTAEELCYQLLFQDESIRCALPKGHDGEHKSRAMIDWRPKLEVRPVYKKEVWEEDTNYKSITNGNGLWFSVPNWVARILERHQDEL